MWTYWLATSWTAPSIADFGSNLPNHGVPYAFSGYRDAFCLIARAAKQHPIPNIALHLPYVRGMSLQDVDRVEINLTLVLLGQFVQGGNLPSKRRSGVAAEDENDGFTHPK